MILFITIIILLLFNWDQAGGHTQVGEEIIKTRGLGAKWSQAPKLWNRAFCWKVKDSNHFPTQQDGVWMRFSTPTLCTQLPNFWDELVCAGKTIQRRLHAKSILRSFRCYCRILLGTLWFTIMPGQTTIHKHVQDKWSIAQFESLTLFCVPSGKLAMQRNHIMSTMKDSMTNYSLTGLLWFKIIAKYKPN